MTGGFPIGRQPLRAGMHRPLPHCGTRNISYTKITYNNFGTGMGMYPMGGMYGMYGGYDTGMSKGEKWMLGIGGAASIIGAIASAFGGDDNADGKGGKTVTSEASLTPEQQQWIDDTNKKMQEMQKSIETLTAENKGLKAQQAQIEALKAASKKHEAQQTDDLTAGARQLEPTTETTTYEVRGKKNADGTNTGDTGYNIVAGLYKSEDGTPLTNSQIKEICAKIFEGKALKTGNIELPNSVEVNGKTYTIDANKTKTPEDMHKNVNQQTYGLGNFTQTFESGAKQVDGKWVGTVNGKDIAGQYETEAEAKAAAQSEIDKQKAAETGE